MQPLAPHRPGSRREPTHRDPADRQVYGVHHRTGWTSPDGSDGSDLAASTATDSGSFTARPGQPLPLPAANGAGATRPAAPATRTPRKTSPFGLRVRGPSRPGRAPPRLTRRRTLPGRVLARARATATTRAEACPAGRSARQRAPQPTAGRRGPGACEKGRGHRAATDAARCGHATTATDTTRHRSTHAAHGRAGDGTRRSAPPSPVRRSLVPPRSHHAPVRGPCARLRFA